MAQCVRPDWSGIDLASSGRLRNSVSSTCLASFEGRSFTGIM